MEIALSTFHYFLQATGTSGGLASIKLNFKPDRIEGQQIDDVKAVARDCINGYTRVLDALYGDVIDGKKEPLLMDNPLSTSTGYCYRGHFTRKGLHVLEQRLQETFGEEPVPPRGELSLYASQEATVLCSFGKSDTGFNNCTVEMSFNMNHILNVCFFRFTKRLEGIRIESPARVSMEKLEKTLKIIAGGENVDYYDLLA